MASDTEQHTKGRMDTGHYLPLLYVSDFMLEADHAIFQVRLVSLILATRRRQSLNKRSRTLGPGGSASSYSSSSDAAAAAAAAGRGPLLGLHLHRCCCCSSLHRGKCGQNSCTHKGGEKTKRRQRCRRRACCCSCPAPLVAATVPGTAAPPPLAAAFMSPSTINFADTTFHCVPRRPNQTNMTTHTHIPFSPRSRKIPNTVFFLCVQITLIFSIIITMYIQVIS